MYVGTDSHLRRDLHGSGGLALDIRRAVVFERITRQAEAHTALLARLCGSELVRFMFCMLCWVCVLNRDRDRDRDRKGEDKDKEKDKEKDKDN